MIEIYRDPRTNALYAYHSWYTHPLSIAHIYTTITDKHIELPTITHQKLREIQPPHKSQLQLITQTTYGTFSTIITQWLNTTTRPDQEFEHKYWESIKNEYVHSLNAILRIKIANKKQKQENLHRIYLITLTPSIQEILKETIKKPSKHFKETCKPEAYETLLLLWESSVNLKPCTIEILPNNPESWEKIFNPELAPIKTCLTKPNKWQSAVGFFSKIPEAQPCLIKRENDHKIIGRTILWKINNKLYCDRIYTTSPQYKKQAVKKFKEIGIQPIHHENTNNPPKISLLCPIKKENPFIPYLDTLRFARWTPIENQHYAYAIISNSPKQSLKHLTRILKKCNNKNKTITQDCYTLNQEITQTEFLKQRFKNIKPTYTLKPKPHQESPLDYAIDEEYTYEDIQNKIKYIKQMYPLSTLLLKDQKEEEIEEEILDLAKYTLEQKQKITPKQAAIIISKHIYQSPYNEIIKTILTSTPNETLVQILENAPNKEIKQIIAQEIQNIPRAKKYIQKIIENNLEKRKTLEYEIIQEEYIDEKNKRNQKTKKIIKSIRNIHPEIFALINQLRKYEESYSFLTPPIPAINIILHTLILLEKHPEEQSNKTIIQIINKTLRKTTAYHLYNAINTYTNKQQKEKMLAVCERYAKKHRLLRLYKSTQILKQIINRR